MWNSVKATQACEMKLRDGLHLESQARNVIGFSIGGEYVVQVGLHTVNTKLYDTGTGTGETVPVVSVSLTVKRYL